VPILRPKVTRISTGCNCIVYNIRGTWYSAPQSRYEARRGLFAAEFLPAPARSAENSPAKQRKWKRRMSTSDASVIVLVVATASFAFSTSPSGRTPRVRVVLIQPYSTGGVGALAFLLALGCVSYMSIAHPVDRSFSLLANKSLTTTNEQDR